MCANITCAVIQPPLVGELQQINKNPRNILISVASSPHLAYERRAQSCANNRFAAGYLLCQHYWHYIVFPTSPTFPEFAFLIRQY
jgi:hypothetical protein